MSERRSLADDAVDALAAVARMDANITNEDPERHQIRKMKRLAEMAIAEGLRQAQELVWLAEDLRKTMKESRDEQ